MTKPIRFSVWHQPSRYHHGYWEVFVDVNENFGVEKVSFHEPDSLRGTLHFDSAPSRVHKQDGSLISRFSSTSIEDGDVIIKISDNSRSFCEICYVLEAGGAGKSNRVKIQDILVRRKNWNSLLSTPDLPSKHTFGVELELSDSNGVSRSTVAQAIQNRTGQTVKVVRSYSEAHDPVPTWKLVHDGSIVCNRSSPYCSKFELVSPILQGESGLNRCNDILRALRASSQTSIQVNKSMGFHVHVSVAGFSLDKLKKLCMNFVKYESAMDMFMPSSRWTGGSVSADYCKSNKEAIRNPSGTIAKLNGGRHKAIAACSNPTQLCNLMNPGRDRYYKLNFQNLLTCRQPTVEFRQHSATANADKVMAWVRFCVTFVRNSALKPTPSYLQNNLEAEAVLDHLFEDLIQCNTLENFYRDRAEALEVQQLSANMNGLSLRQQNDRPCCSGCARGHACASSNHSRQWH